MDNLNDTILDFGTWITEEEGNVFLRKIGIDQESINTDFGSLQKITEAVISNLPFHNLFLITRPPTPPSSFEIKDDMMQLRGGPCGTMNPFLGALLRTKGFNVCLVSGTMMEPNCHLGLMVKINDCLYYVDVGDGKPYYEPMKVNETVEKSYPSHKFRHFTQNDNLLIQYSNDLNEWTTTCTINLTPRKFAFFENSIRKHYSDDSYGPFSKNFRLVKYPKKRILGFRNFTFMSEHNNIYLRENIAYADLLVERAEFYFGNHQLPIKKSINLLIEKGYLSHE